jgi:hypothetical protein
MALSNPASGNRLGGNDEAHTLEPTSQASVKRPDRLIATGSVALAASRDHVLTLVGATQRAGNDPIGLNRLGG